ncbi:MAG: aminotransferase class V-fold PLP-dependent enzyme [Candidatus Micrarchaeota archaeon]|nr:aminotransferase class V-fold PLP-dependent enzyme [Candidatus Micrarchaeota archaeon]
MIGVNESIRRDFPLLRNRKITYFDNACTTLKPQAVIDAVNGYNSEYSGCAHGRSPHRLSRDAEAAFEGARRKVAEFVGARANELLWTRNTTEGLNLVSRTIDFSKRQNVVTTVMEHHSALLPFQLLAKSGKIALDFVGADGAGRVSTKSFEEKISGKTRLVVVHHTTNTTGTTAPLQEITKIAHDNGALVLVDGAQGVPHKAVDFGRMGADFFAFSGHKMLGPTGIGCLVGRRAALEELAPFIVGGGTVTSVSLESCTFDKLPSRLEGGTQDLAGGIGLGAAADYLKKVGMHRVEEHEKKLAKALIEGLGSVEGVKIYGPLDWREKCAVVSFNVGKMDPREVALMLDHRGFAVRSGFFCAEPAMRHLGAPHGAVRASLYLYNTEDEIGAFLAELKKIARIA